MEPHQLELLKISLSQRHAKQKLLDGVAEQLQLESRRLTLLPVRTLLAFAEPGALLTVLSGVVLLACSATGCDPMQSAQSAALGCGLLLLAMLNAWVTAREEHREATELISRARGWLNQVSQHQTSQSRSPPSGCCGTACGCGCTLACWSRGTCCGSAPAIRRPDGAASFCPRRRRRACACTSRSRRRRPSSP